MKKKNQRVYLISMWKIMISSRQLPAAWASMRTGILGFKKKDKIEVK